MTRLVLVRILTYFLLIYTSIFVCISYSRSCCGTYIVPSIYVKGRSILFRLFENYISLCDEIGGKKCGLAKFSLVKQYSRFLYLGFVFTFRLLYSFFLFLLAIRNSIYYFLLIGSGFTFGCVQGSRADLIWCVVGWVAILNLDFANVWFIVHTRIEENVTSSSEFPRKRIQETGISNDWTNRWFLRKLTSVGGEKIEYFLVRNRILTCIKLSFAKFRCSFIGQYFLFHFSYDRWKNTPQRNTLLFRTITKTKKKVYIKKKKKREKLKGISFSLFQGKLSNCLLARLADAGFSYLSYLDSTYLVFNRFFHVAFFFYSFSQDTAFWPVEASSWYRLAEFFA